MKISLKHLLFACMLLPAALSAQTLPDNPMVRIAMDAYAAQIKENPDDYMPYYNRAKDYFKYGINDLALADLDNAIRLFPRKETADLSQAYTLRAFIYQQRGEFTKALNDFNEALTLDPSSRFSLIGRADLLYENGEYDHAKKDYELLLRQDARCQEAYLGLGRIAYRENNMGLAEDYLSKAEEANPSNPLFYVQRGSFYDAIGEYDKAAADYVHALVYDGNNSAAIASLNVLTTKDFNAVIAAISNTVDNVQDKGFFYFLRALIYKNNWHYTASIKDWNTILAEKYFYTHSIFYNRAYCYFHLGQFEYALNDIDMAISLNADDLSYHILKAEIYRVMGEYDSATRELSMAATFNPTDLGVLQQSGILAAEQGDYDKALRYYNDAILNNADDAYSYLLRAYLYELSGDTTMAANNYETIASMPKPLANVYSLRGFALARLGRVDEANAWLKAALDSSQSHSGEEYYYAACLAAQMGQKQQALQYVEEALKKGYGDYYNIYFYNDSPVSLEPLRTDPDFRSLVSQYSSVF